MDHCLFEDNFNHWVQVQKAAVWKGLECNSGSYNSGIKILEKREWECSKSNILHHFLSTNYTG